MRSLQCRPYRIFPIRNRSTNILHVENMGKMCYIILHYMYAGIMLTYRDGNGCGAKNQRR